ncbi:glycosyltransferase family 1 protein [Amniculicola lignicola CBS 123094]|uniref:Glycosyltransferase family 1 protein n=1 Tax=Amniculicola lignicola CBS 123094 TaxID=1392246 RepID=A0A6A5WV14_9PLEO|nr:glycosyltransferase family 1 protein [Amniculicola lignicola CBS 123094]
MAIRSMSSEAEEERRSEQGDASTSLHLRHLDSQHERPRPNYLDGDEISNADLYAMTPPAYALSVADNEVSLDAESMHEEKRPISPVPSSPSTLRAESDTGSHTPPEEQPPPLPARPTVLAAYSSHAPVYISSLATEAALAHVRRCSLLPNRPAVWLVKKKDLALSPLAAAVLVKEGLIRYKDLEPISQSAGIKRDPSDPLSGILFATYDTVGDIMLGLVQGPMEASRQITPALIRLERKRNEGQQQQQQQQQEEEEVEGGGGEPRPILHEASPLLAPHPPPINGPRGAENPHPTHPEPPVPNPTSWEPKVQPSNEPKPSPPSAPRTPNAGKQIATETGKGLGRIVGASLKAPMTFSHAITRGFHNIPKLYGEEVREHENITGMSSGLAVSAKGFGHGLGDGLRDFFVKPIEGAREDGSKGFIKGVGKGIGNVVCKPAAGAVGLVGYSFVGLYKEIEKLGKGNNSAEELYIWQGETERGQATDEERLDIVKRWCQALSRLRL